MLWRKKQAEVAPATAGKASPVATAGSKPEADPAPKDKVKIEKLPGPRMVPGLVEKQLVGQYKVDADLVRVLKAVVRRRPQGEKAFDCRVFDESDAETRQVKVIDYTTLDAHPELVLYEGWYDEEAKQAQMTEKRKITADIPLLTEAEILAKIEALSEPGNTVFFYQARGPAFGGPLGRGAAIVELVVDPKKGKKYNIYTANVVGMDPAPVKTKLFNSSKPKDIAKWIKEAHHKRMV